MSWWKKFMNLRLCTWTQVFVGWNVHSSSESDKGAWAEIVSWKNPLWKCSFEFSGFSCVGWWKYWTRVVPSVTSWNVSIEPVVLNKKHEQFRASARVLFIRWVYVCKVKIHSTHSHSIRLTAEVKPKLKKSAWDNESLL